MFEKCRMPVLVGFVCISLLAVSPAFADKANSESKIVSPEVSDALRGLAVRAKLADKLGIGALRISVTVVGDRATLTGEVAKKATQELAKEVALSVEGIKSVDNQVKESIPASTMANAEAELKDSGLEIKVKTLLLNEIGSNALDITVESTDGVVSLRGRLDNKELARAATTKVQSIAGVKKVINLLGV